MSANDLVSDVLARIYNGQRASLAFVAAPFSKLVGGVLEVLKTEGYIRGYEEEKDGKGHSSFRVDLKYYDGEPVIKKIKRVSKPGRRVYSSISDLPKVHNGLGISILSTSRGILSDHEAREKFVGGEVLCTVF